MIDRAGFCADFGEGGVRASLGVAWPPAIRLVKAYRTLNSVFLDDPINDNLGLQMSEHEKE